MSRGPIIPGHSNRIIVSLYRPNFLPLPSFMSSPITTRCPFAILLLAALVDRSRPSRRRRGGAASAFSSSSATPPLSLSSLFPPRCHRRCSRRDRDYDIAQRVELPCGTADDDEHSNQIVHTRGEGMVGVVETMTMMTTAKLEAATQQSNNTQK